MFFSAIVIHLQLILTCRGEDHNVTNIIYVTRKTLKLGVIRDLSNCMERDAV